MPELRLQPIVDLRTGGTLGLELLAGQHCCPGWAGPQWQAWYARMRDALEAHAPADGRIFVNVDSAQIVDPVIRQALDDLVASRPCVLEWTERDADRDTHERATRWLRDCAARGVAVAVDDIGHGTDGIGRVLNVQPTYAKLDAGLTRRAIDDSAMGLLRRLNDLFSSLGCDVIAEGIETDEDVAHCRSAGIRYGQGFYFGAGDLRG